MQEVYNGRNVISHSLRKRCSRSVLGVLFGCCLLSIWHTYETNKATTVRKEFTIKVAETGNPVCKHNLNERNVFNVL